MRPEICLAHPEDEIEIFEICRRLHGEIGVFPMNASKVIAMIRSLIAQNGGIIGVIRNEKQIEAMICLAITQFWYSDEFILEEQLNYVLPEYRKSDNAKELIIFARAAAEQLRIPLAIGILSSERMEAKIRLYKRQLGAPTGAVFLIGAKTGQPCEYIGAN